MSRRRKICPVHFDKTFLQKTKGLTGKWKGDRLGNLTCNVSFMHGPGGCSNNILCLDRTVFKDAESFCFVKKRIMHKRKKIVMKTKLIVLEHDQKSRKINKRMKLHNFQNLAATCANSLPMALISNLPLKNAAEI